MGILSGLFKSRDKPQNRTAGSAYSCFMGGSSSGKQVNERSAMQMTAVYSCVRILSEARPSALFFASGRAEPGNDIFCVPRNTDDTSAPLGQRLCADYPQRKG